MADGMVKAAVDKLEELAFQELKLQSQVGKKVQGLKDDLEWLRAFLRDADQRRRQELNEYLELWVRQTREVAFDAEDLLEEYVYKGQMHRHGFHDLSSFVRWLRQSAAGLFVRRSIFTNIAGIQERLEDIKNKRNEHDLKRFDSTWAHPQKHYSDWSELSEGKIEDPRNLTGIRKKLKKIEGWLVKPEKRQLRTVIAITGKSGVGKTTLTSCVYESRAVRSRFYYTIWVHVPQKFRMVDILRDIILQTAGPYVTEAEKREEKENVTGMNEKALMDELAKKLSNKNYLIVLDDVRRVEEWNFFLAVLPAYKGNEGSGVLITTVSPSVFGANSSLCDPFHHVELKKLKDGQGRQMFCRRVFGIPNFPKDFRNKDMHSNAIENLLHHSLPLAVTLLAGLLRSKKEDEWTEVINQLQHSVEMEQLQAGQQAETKQKQQAEEKRELKQKQQAEEKRELKQKQQAEGNRELKQQQPKSGGIPLWRSLIDKILMLSFDDLPPDLKQCFLYFAALKAEEDIDSEKLIRLWVAEGLVHATDGRTMEEQALDCLKMLISRCLINLVQMDCNKNIITISIHEHVLAFAMSEARETNFLRVHHSTTDLPRTPIRRLALQNAFDPQTRLALATPKLRTLLCEFPEAPAGDDANKSTVIPKVWGLIRGRVNTFNIHRCKFLRVIDLKGAVQRTTLPDEIGWLIHLRYLGLADTRLKRLPGSVKDLRNLQTLDITDTPIKAVPQDFWKLQTLRHVLARRLKNGPHQVNTLNNLQTLHGVPWGPWARNKRLTNLRSLQVWKLSRTRHCEDLLTCLDSMECLTSLHMEAEEGVHLPLEELLSMLVLRNLQCLKLDGATQGLDGAIQGATQTTIRSYSYLLPNLSKLELCKLNLAQKHIDMIADLPNLLELMLGEDSYKQKHLVIPYHGFRVLRKLQLSGLTKLEAWEVEVAVPQNQLAVLQNQENKVAVPQNQVAVPQNQENEVAVPQNKVAVPENQVALPQNEVEVPQNEVEVAEPENEVAVQENEVAVPKPENKVAVPKKEVPVPLRHLEYMSIFSCTELTMIPEYLKELPKLVLLTCHDLPKLLMLPPVWKFKSTNLKILSGEQV